MNRIAATLLLAFLACAPAPTPAPQTKATGGDGIGTDLEREAECLSCHASVRAASVRVDSHAQLFDCGTCHAPTDKPAGPGHAPIAECGGCHSERTHPARTECVVCHDPHGSTNLFLLRPAIATALNESVPVELSAAVGAGAGGLAQRAAGGLGVCEVCHAGTRYYSRAGGAEHHGAWCVKCHPHNRGFAPGEP